MLTLEQREARAFRYLCVRGNSIVLDDGYDSEGNYGWCCGPTDGEFTCYARNPVDAIESCVAKIRASFDPQWGMDCEPTAPDASLEGVPHGD